MQSKVKGHELRELSKSALFGCFSVSLCPQRWLCLSSRHRESSSGTRVLQSALGQRAGESQTFLGLIACLGIKRQGRGESNLMLLLFCPMPMCHILEWTWTWSSVLEGQELGVIHMDISTWKGETNWYIQMAFGKISDSVQAGEECNKEFDNREW